MFVQEIDVARVLVQGNCVITGQNHRVVVPAAGFAAWQGGSLIQDALPDVSLEDREFLISGVSPAGWAQLGPEPE
jgi:hypothetical protein